MQIAVEKTHDAYTWGVQYTDDTCIAEYDRPEGRGFAEVDQLRVKELLLLSLAGGMTHSVHVPQGAIPVFFRRRRIEINPFGMSDQARSTVHCIGWARGKNATYLFVFDDNHTLLTTDLQAV